MGAVPPGHLGTGAGGRAKCCRGSLIRPSSGLEMVLPVSTLWSDSRSPGHLVMGTWWHSWQWVILGWCDVAKTSETGTRCLVVNLSFSGGPVSLRASHLALLCLFFIRLSGVDY